MTGPLAVNINVSTQVADNHVTHSLSLVESLITVTLARDISALGRQELVATLGQLLPLMEAIWSESPGDGDTFVLDMRRKEG